MPAKPASSSQPSDNSAGLISGEGVASSDDTTRPPSDAAASIPRVISSGGSSSLQPCDPASLRDRAVERRKEVLLGLVDSVEILPTVASVPFRIMELRRQRLAGAKEFAEVLSADVSLCTRILALTNSAWFSPTRPVTTIPDAITFIGLGNLLPVVFAGSIAGMYSRLDMAPDEVGDFWQCSLLKAVAAREYARLYAPKCVEQAFVAGLVQDLGLPFMRVADRSYWLELLKAIELDNEARVARENWLFNLDHAQLGGMIAARLKMPEVYHHTTAWHHSPEELLRRLEDPGLAKSVMFAAAMPHLVEQWRRLSPHRLRRVFGADVDSNNVNADFEPLLETIHKEYHTILSMFGQGKSASMTFKEFMQEATHDFSRCIEAAIGESTLLANMFQEREAQLKTDLDEIGRQARQANQDELTGIFNRRGFTNMAKRMYEKGTEEGFGLAVGFVDLDNFKHINDQLGHDAGDAALKSVASLLKETLGRRAIVGRIGGDEYSFCIMARDESEAMVAVQAAESRLSDLTVRTPNNTSFQVTASIGMVWSPKLSRESSFDTLLKEADQFMYNAKRAGKARCVVGRSGSGDPSTPNTHTRKTDRHKSRADHSEGKGHLAA